ncbi:nitrilase-related carbon-nitrogen hydrolase [Kibdelosporangium persicum]|uniref:Beta-cyano-L-alanine hydratase/nitrilase n=1 Tax=Kibdelosporangium persicum TaxID=2698649 RepID=A0ABX2FHJ8_9PSEU|nr:nitrilase-related carbon-nitrogen hydrolase [Kibdelosporangium persicum]NRN70340.1 Beta-cyano-L-alanine hydratase/nitrilase [Kibdelosporangium persicum]
MTTRAAVAQATPVLFDPAATLDVVADWSARAAEAGAELLVFPEAFIGGYPKGSTFGAVVGDRTVAGREQFRRYLEAAITVPGDECLRLGRIARQNGESPKSAVTTTTCDWQPAPTPGAAA